jgi:hypothetical protein
MSAATDVSLSRRENARQIQFATLAINALMCAVVFLSVLVKLVSASDHTEPLRAVDFFCWALGGAGVIVGTFAWELTRPRLRRLMLVDRILCIESTKGAESTLPIELIKRVYVYSGPMDTVSSCFIQVRNRSPIRIEGTLYQDLSVLQPLVASLESLGVSVRHKRTHFDWCSLSTHLLYTAFLAGSLCFLTYLFPTHVLRSIDSFLEWFFF